MPGNHQRTVLITGCGRKRLGHVIAQHLAKQGWNIAVHFHRSHDQAKDNAASYRQSGVRAETFQADVSEEADVRQMVADVVTTFSTIDALVTTASIWHAIPLDQVTGRDVLRSFQVNTLGTFLCCQQVGLQMTQQSTGGSIITIADSLNEHPYVDHAAYFTAKGSIPTLTKAMAVELASRNRQVRVNAIAPGPVMFPGDMSAEEARRTRESTLSHVADDPESVARTVEFLIDTPMVNGAVIPVDAGRNIGREDMARKACG